MDQFAGLKAGSAIGQPTASAKNPSPADMHVRAIWQNNARLEGISSHLRDVLVRIRGAHPEGVSDEKDCPPPAGFFHESSKAVSRQAEAIALLEAQIGELQNLF